MKKPAKPDKPVKTLDDNQLERVVGGHQGSNRTVLQYANTQVVVC